MILLSVPQVVVTAQATSRHECWDDAIERICALTGAERAATWLRGERDEVFVFVFPTGTAQAPVAWVTNPRRYQAATSRGDLEDVPAFFSRHAVEPTTARHQPTTVTAMIADMIKPATLTPKTKPGEKGRRATLSPKAKADREAYIVVSEITWHGATRSPGDRIDFARKGSHTNRDRWLKTGKIKRAEPPVAEDELFSILGVRVNDVLSDLYGKERFRILAWERDNQAKIRLYVACLTSANGARGIWWEDCVQQLSVPSCGPCIVPDHGQGKPVYHKPEDACAKAEPEPEQPAQPAQGQAAPLVQVQMVALGKIRPDATQPRKEFAPGPMAELVESVKVHGIEQAILVRPMSRWRQIVRHVAQQWLKRQRGEYGYGICGKHFRDAGVEFGKGEEWGGASINRLHQEGRIEHAEMLSGWDAVAGALAPLTGETTLLGEEEWYEIVYGERRWRAAQEAGLTEIPAKVRELTDIEAAEKQGIENLDRADLLPLEVAAQYRKLLDLPGYGMERLMQVTGHAKNTIHGKLLLLKLPEKAKEAVARGDLGQVTAERIARLDGRVQEAVIGQVLNKRNAADGEKVMSDRATQSVIEQEKKKEAERVKADEMKAEATRRGLAWLEGKEREKVFGYYSQPNKDSGLVMLSQTVAGDPEYRSFNTILAKKPGKAAAKVIKPIKATIGNAGALVELYDERAVLSALAAAGVKFTARKQAANPEEAKRRQKDKHMKAVLAVAARQLSTRAQALVPRIAHTPEAAGMWLALARAAVQRVSNDDLRYFVKRRGLVPITKDYGSGKPQPQFAATVQAYLEQPGLGLSDVAGTVVELLLTAAAWWSYNDDFCKGFLANAAAFGLDFKQIKEDVAGGEGGEDKSAQDDEPGPSETESASARTDEEPVEEQEPEMACP